MSRKNKNQPSKKRIEHVYGTTVDNINSLIIRVNPVTGSIEFDQPMTNVYSEVNYERPKGPKVLSRIPQSPEHASFDAEHALEIHFDLVFGVDTNTRLIKGRKVSVTGVASYMKGTPPLGAKTLWRPDIFLCWEFIDLRTDKKENFGWLAAFEELVRRGIVRDGHRVGLIIDSDLGSISAYNARTKPIFGDRELPKGVRLIYASADTGSESITNRFLQAADKVSNQVLDMIESGTLEFNKCTHSTEWYAGSRLVNVDVEEADAMPY